MNVNISDLDKTIEHWASIDGYLNYQVSWFGRVVNTKTGRILRARICPQGYQRVNLYIDGKPKTHTIHQLVAREWVRNPEEKRCVDHIDGNRKTITTKTFDMQHMQKTLETQAREQIPHQCIMASAYTRQLINGTLRFKLVEDGKI